MKQRLNWHEFAPEGMAALRAAQAVVAKSGLDAKLLELVKMRASQINGCAYCLHMHLEEARKLGESDERLLLLDAWRESSLYTPRERAALAWTEALTKVAETHAPDDVYEAARREFSERDLVHLSIAIGMINIWNRMQIGFRATHPAELKKAA